MCCTGWWMKEPGGLGWTNFWEHFTKHEFGKIGTTEEKLKRNSALYLITSPRGKVIEN